MATLKTKTAHITRLESGPDQVVVIFENENGDPFDFDIDIPRGNAEEYLRKMGFETCELTTYKVKANSKGRRRVVPKSVELSLIE